MTTLLPLTDVAALRARADLLDPETLATATEIVAAVRRGGEPALREYAERFGDLEAGQPLCLERGDLEQAYREVGAPVQALLERTADRIRAFAVAQRECLVDLTVERDGFTMGHECVPVQRAGCYAPGGRYPLPSSVLMTAIPARVAGVDEVVVASPRPAPATRAAAFVAGADRLLPVGGAQAIAALAYLRECDVVVGPGNRFVTAAKHVVSQHVGIDMLAGPSELVVLADASADPRLVAADLIAQAEHDEDALPILVTTAESMAGAVRAELTTQLDGLPTAAVATVALRRGGTLLAADLEAARAMCDELAAEHLAVHVDGALEFRNAGAVFAGAQSAEVFGDYGVGPNHVLPTGGQARHTAGLSVFTFLRTRTFLRGAADANVREDVARFADLEGLPGHAAAARARAPN